MTLVGTGIKKRLNKLSKEDKLELFQYIKEDLNAINRTECIAMDSCAKATTPCIESGMCRYAGTPMSTVQVTPPKSDEMQQRAYLLQRVEEIYEKRYLELRKAFFMDEVRPTTAKDLIRVIETGKYSLREGSEWRGWDVMDQITWRDPEKQPDAAGYKEAYDKERLAFAAAKDSIMCGTIATTALSALRKYEELPIK